MADIKKKLSELLVDYADNNVGNITPQLLRNGFKTAIGSMAVSAVNSDYILVEDDIFVNVIPTTANINVLIPSPSNFKEKYFIIKNSGTTYNVIVSGSVDNSTNYTLTPGNTLGIEANGSTWLSYITPAVLKTGDTMTGSLNVPSVSANYIRINTSTAFTSGFSISAGTISWNSDDKTINLGLENGSVLQVGQEELLYAVNQTGLTITNGQVVKVTGSSGNRVVVSLGQATTSAQGQPFFAISTQNIGNNQTGYFTRFGLVRELNTAAWNEGDLLWLSTSAGMLTNVQPSKEYTQVPFAIVTRSHATVGTIIVSPVTVPRLQSLAGVDITSATNGNTLVYVSATGTWQNYGNVYGWEDAAQKFYNKEYIWDSTTTTVSANSASWTGGGGGGNLTPVSMRYYRTYATTQDMGTSANSQNTLHDSSGGITWVNGGYQNALTNYPGVVTMPNAITQVSVGMSLMQIVNLTGSNLVSGATATFNVLIIRMTATGYAVVATVPLVFTYTGATLTNGASSNRNAACMFATAKVTGLNIPAGSLIGASYYTSSNWRVLSDVMWTISYEG